MAIGKITTIAGTVLAIICSPIFGHYTTIFEGINKLISYVAPPVTAVFLCGVFWKKASGKAAFSTMVAGTLLGTAAFCLDWTKLYTGDFMLTAFFLLLACVAIMIAASFAFPEKLKEEAVALVWEDWREPLRRDVNGNGLGNYRTIVAGLLAVFVGLYLWFR